MKNALNFILSAITVMFSTILFSCSITLICRIPPVLAMDVNLSWDANTEPDLAGYKIYYKTELDAPYVDQNTIEDPNASTYTVHNLSNIKTYFVITAYDTSGLESGYSSEVMAEANDDPNIETPISPEVKESYPYPGAGINDDVRIPHDTSFSVFLEEFEGIDITDANSIKFTINDGVNAIYERDLSDANVVRVVKFDLEESDTQVTKLWVVYDRSNEVELGAFTFDQTINIKIDAKNISQEWMEQVSYDFKIETEQEYNDAQANLPSTEDVAGDDPALTGLYDDGIQVAEGDLSGAKIVYNSAEPVTPIFGPVNEVTILNLSNVEAVGAPVPLQPLTVFTTPVKIFIPCPGWADVSELSVYFYNGASWVMACNAEGQVQPDGEAWMVPDSRVNHNEDDPATIEIKVYYFSVGVQAGKELPRNLIGDNVSPGSSGGGGGCFIDSL